jgi:hypothetical protein
VDTAHTVMPCTQVSSFAPSVTRQTQRLEISMLNLGGTNATPDMNRFFFSTTKMKGAETPSSPSSSEDDDPPLPTECTPSTPLTNRQLDFDSPPITEEAKEELTPLVQIASEAELENIRLKRTIARLEKELAEAKQEKKEAKRSDNKNSVNQTFKQEVTELVEGFIKKKYKRMGRQRIGKLLASAFFNLDDGVAQTEILTLARKEFRRTIFSAWRILRAMDLNGGTLNYAGIEVLRSLETLGEKYYHGSMIPSTKELQRVAK